MNPVLAREAKERFRSRRSFPFLTLWVLAVGMLTYALYLLAQLTARNTGLGRLLATGYVGRFLFQSMVLLLMTAVIFLVPASAAVGIVGERERQTLSLLQVTQLTPMQLVLGKLSASIGYLLVLLVAALPMAAVPLLFGGAAFGDVLAALGMLLLTAVMLGSISIWVSARARSSRGAVAGSLSLTFLIAFFTFAVMGAQMFWQIRDGRQWAQPEGREVAAVWLNPFFGIVDAVNQPYELRQDIVTTTPFMPFEIVLLGRQGINMTGGFIENIPAGAVDLIDGRQVVNSKRLPVFVYTVVLYLLITGLSLWRAARAVTAPGGRNVRLKRSKNADS